MNHFLTEPEKDHYDNEPDFYQEWKDDVTFDRLTPCDGNYSLDDLPF